MAPELLKRTFSSTKQPTKKGQPTFNKSFKNDFATSLRDCRNSKFVHFKALKT